MQQRANGAFPCAVALLLCLAGCTQGNGFGEGQPLTEPPAPTCPETADCSDLECGIDPICGLECGPCGDAATCTLAGVCCVPTTCAELGADCGLIDDGCGAQLECGVCAFGMVCSPEDGEGTSCSCPTVADGESIWIDIQTVAVQLQPRLDGAPPSTDNTSLESHANFLLKPIGGPTGVGWHRVQLNLLDEATEALQSELDFRVMPGNYALYYEFRGSSKEGAWPLNSRFRLDEQLSIDGDVTLPVEISTSVVTLDLRVDGVALAALPLLEGQVVEVRLEGGEGGVTLAHLEGGNPETSWILPTARLIPAGYQITWSNNLGSEGAPLPYGYSSALPLGSGSSGASLSVGDQDGNLLIDIETAEVTLALLQDGEAPSQVGFGAGDDPRVLLLPRGASAPQGMGAQQDHQPPSDGDGEGDYPNAPDPSLNPGGNSAVIAPPFWDLSSGTSSDSLVLRVLPGNYDVLYTHTASATDPLDGTERRWAHNGAMLDDNLTIYPGAEFEWNIESAVVEVDVLLDGAALSESLCTGGGAAIRMLWAQAFPGKMRTQWRLPDLCATDSGQPRTPYSIRLVVGSYDFHYSTSAGALGPAWPRHEAPVTLDVNRAVAADTTLDINIPVVELTLNITTTGTPPPSPGEEEEEDLNQWPHIELAELGMDAPQQLGWSRPASVALPLQSTLPPLLLIPSNYTIAYLARNTGLGPDWPNASYRVETAVLIDGDINLSYDLDTSRVGIELSLNGLPADLSNTGPGDHGKLTLVRADPQGTFNWVSPWRDEQLNTEPQLINLPSGHYQLLYYPAGYEHSQTISFETIDYGGGWPLSAGTYAGCIDVE